MQIYLDICNLTSKEWFNCMGDQLKVLVMAPSHDQRWYQITYVGCRQRAALETINLFEHCFLHMAGWY